MLKKDLRSYRLTSLGLDLPSFYTTAIPQQLHKTMLKKDLRSYRLTSLGLDLPSFYTTAIPQQLHKTMLKKDRFQHINKTPLLQSHCVFTSHLCLKILEELYKMLFTSGAQPSFHWFREEVSPKEKGRYFFHCVNPQCWAYID
jgi:hypothetical protein